ncbi:zinc finger protein 729-like isoform X8 [Spodoptera litura]|uniref:Zinc finger protein 729-like isoform X8 n=1 Tax=Spodoptera litura TaxID=69820 RepID=A0A9J7DY18_SPOLT|nr:zinc finger protein 729-like isoform X8 [Spodoptera litura]
METAGHSNMCRCCASEGAFKDIKSTYHWMGEEEIYADMLKDCFDINLNVSEHGEDGGICEVCITQLRNAINFKKQVQHTEEQFKKHLQNKALFRPNIVKVEVGGEEDSDGDNMGSGDDAFSGAEFDVPIKTEEDDPKPKKRSKASATTTRSKKSKSDDGEPSTKRVPRNVNAKIEKDCDKKLKRITRSKSEQLEDTKPNELIKHRSNIRLILQCSNATPIRCRGGIGYACCFCGDQFPDPAELKKHTLQGHDDKTKLQFMEGKMMFSFLVKLDITNLKCNICEVKFDKLEQFVEHLIKEHDKKIFTDIKSHVLPFKFDDDVLRCLYCQNVFNKFKNLQQHMNVHCRNYICKYCDAGFVNKHILACHTEGHKIGTFKCDLCSKVFDTLRKKKSHEKSVHIHANLLSKCGYCYQKFTTYRQRDIHLVKVHGVELKAVKCHACDKTFDSKSALTIHTKRDHLMERPYKCTQCDMKFFGSNELKLHMVKHTGVREFKCTICFKSYGRKKTLTEHMRIHNDDRRFKCEHCGQAFVQKCSWKGHMRNRHGELV